MMWPTTTVPVMVCPHRQQVGWGPQSRRMRVAVASHPGPRLMGVSLIRGLGVVTYVESRETT